MKISYYIASYIESALWSSYDENDRPLDRNYTDEDLHPKTLEKMIKDCNSFEDILTEKFPEIDFDWVQVAHDFWLTRNRYGAGFWDGDYEEELGEALTEICHKFGECNLYIGYDGKIYSE